jgi:hypothetical protein
MALSPFDNPVPTGYIETISAYARDLAWGVSQGYWSRGLNLYKEWYVAPPVNEADEGDEREVSEDVSIADKEFEKFFNKWFPEDKPANAPDPVELAFWGFVVQSNIQRSAFDLLIHPVQAPKVFVSYRRGASSTFALAIEARLRIVGHHDVFVDKDIEAGKEWFQVLEQKISECDYFVFLVDNNVFDSTWMVEEYNLAVKLNKTIIPIIHPEVVISKFSEDFNKIQFIECRGKASAASYEDAINRLLNRLGYSTF